MDIREYIVERFLSLANESLGDLTKLRSVASKASVISGAIRKAEGAGRIAPKVIPQAEKTVNKTQSLIKGMDSGAREKMLAGFRK